MATTKKHEVVIDGRLENDGGDGGRDHSSSHAGILQGFDKVMWRAMHDGRGCRGKRSQTDNPIVINAPT